MNLFESELTIVMETIASELIYCADLTFQIREFFKAEPSCKFVTKGSSGTTSEWKIAELLTERDL